MIETISKAVWKSRSGCGKNLRTMSYLQIRFNAMVLKFISVCTVAFCMMSFGVFPDLYGQTSYKLVYKVEPILQGSLDNKSQNTKHLVKEIVDYAENLNYLLIVNQEESSFEEEEFLVKGDKNPLEDIYLKAARAITSFNEVTYTNYKTDSIVFIKNLLNKDFVVKRKVYDFNWEVKGDTKKILGFEARKAEGAYYYPVTDEEYKVEAWFIPAIPLRSGPDIFMGLPGIIAEVHLNKAVIKAKRIDKTHLDISKPDEEQAMTQREYEDWLSKLTQKFIDD